MLLLDCRDLLLLETGLVGDARLRLTRLLQRLDLVGLHGDVPERRVRDPLPAVFADLQYARDAIAAVERDQGLAVGL